MEREVLRVSEFCQSYAISKASFYREISADRLHIVKRGRTTLITRAEAERWFGTICEEQAQQSV